MIRHALPDDVCSIGKIYCLSWQYGYKDILPQGFLHTLTPENCTPDLKQLHLADTYVYEINGEIAGLVNVGKEREASADNMGELRALYILPAYFRKGIGKKLFLAAKEDLKKRHYDGFDVWVLKDNKRARCLYEKMGMLPTGQTKQLCIKGSMFEEIQYRYIFTG